jgi:hypothetical protein
MTTNSTLDTGRKDNEETGHPAACDEMTRMMGRCGCGPMMAKMMAACTGAGSTEDAAEVEGKEPQKAE